MLTDVDAYRFEAQVLLDDGCWEWQGSVGSHGYGQCYVNKTVRTAHRVAFEYWRGLIPAGLWVLHHCDNQRCVRPDHLYLGTNSDNMRGCTARGRLNSQQPGHRRKEF